MVGLDCEMSAFQPTHPSFRTPNYRKQLLFQSRPILFRLSESFRNETDSLFETILTNLEQLSTTPQLRSVASDVDFVFIIQPV